MKRLFSLLLLTSLSLTLCLVACKSMTEKVGHTAQQVHYLAGGPTPDTTESGAGQAALDIGRAAVITASQANPNVAVAASVIGIIAGTVAGIAKGKRAAKKNAHTVITEIVSDIKAFKEPDVPWTKATQQLLKDLGYWDEALPIPRPIETCET
jgi:hypothetical protein